MFLLKSHRHLEVSMTFCHDVTFCHALLLPRMKNEADAMMRVDWRVRESEMFCREQSCFTQSYSISLTSWWDTVRDVKFIGAVSNSEGWLLALKCSYLDGDISPGWVYRPLQSTFYHRNILVPFCPCESKQTGIKYMLTCFLLYCFMLACNY